MNISSHMIRVPRRGHGPTSRLLAADRTLLELVEKGVDQGMTPLTVTHDGSSYEILLEDEYGEQVRFWIERYPHILGAHVARSLQEAKALFQN